MTTSVRIESPSGVDPDWARTLSETGHEIQTAQRFEMPTFPSYEPLDFVIDHADEALGTLVDALVDAAVAWARGRFNSPPRPLDELAAVQKSVRIFGPEGAALRIVVMRPVADGVMIEDIEEREPLARAGGLHQRVAI